MFKIWDNLWHYSTFKILEHFSTVCSIIPTLDMFIRVLLYLMSHPVTNRERERERENQKGGKITNPQSFFFSVFQGIQSNSKRSFFFSSLFCIWRVCFSALELKLWVAMWEGTAHNKEGSGEGRGGETWDKKGEFPNKEDVFPDFVLTKKERQESGSTVNSPLYYTTVHNQQKKFYFIQNVTS